VSFPRTLCLRTNSRTFKLPADGIRHGLREQARTVPKRAARAIGVFSPATIARQKAVGAFELAERSQQAARLQIHPFERRLVAGNRTPAIRRAVDDDGWQPWSDGERYASSGYDWKRSGAYRWYTQPDAALQVWHGQ
jgi:hypothetical protein